MNTESKKHRNEAARHLRKSLKAIGAKEKHIEEVLAASYKAIAHGEEWLRGERQRSKKREPKKKP